MTCTFFTQSNKFAFVLIAFFTFGLAGCDGDGDGATNVLTGVFIDSAVEGLRFDTVTQSGTTDVDGTFQYLIGETIQFYIGDIAFPPVQAKGVITPLDIAGATDVNDLVVVNMVRLLLTLDSDYDSGNGINITDNAHSVATGMSLDFGSLTFEADVVNLVLYGGGSSVLVEDFVAEIHMQNTLDALSTQGTAVVITAPFLNGDWRRLSDDRTISCSTADRECIRTSVSNNPSGVIGEPDTTGLTAITNITEDGANYSGASRWSRFDLGTFLFEYFVWPDITISPTSADSITITTHGGPGTVMDGLTVLSDLVSDYVRVGSDLDVAAAYSYTIAEAFDGDWNSLGVDVCIEGWDALGGTPYINPGMCPSSYITNVICNWVESGVEGTTYLPSTSDVSYDPNYACTGFYAGTLQ